MIVEQLKPLNYDVIKTAKPFRMRDSKQRELRIISIINSNNISVDGVTFSIHDFTDFMKLCVGYNVIINSTIIEFHKLILSKCNYSDLFLNRHLFFDGYSLFLLDGFGSYFNIRLGNQWGNIYVLDEVSDENYICEKIQHILLIANKLGWNISHIGPPARMAEHLIRQEVSTMLLPNISSMEIDAIHLLRFLNSFRGGRMEACSLGHFDDVYDYDFNSSHFAILRELPAINSRFVKWIDSKEYQQDAILGSCRIRYYIEPNVKIGLLASRVSIGDLEYRLYYNTKWSEGWRTKSEIDFLIECGQNKFEILEGSWAIPIREPVKPFYGVSRILSKMMEIPDTHDLAKAIAATSWGKFAGQRGGILWNPFYASETAARSRIAITKLALGKENSIIALAIDGILSTSELSEAVITNTNIGGMKCHKYEEMLSLSDFYRYSPEEQYNWDITNQGISINDMETTISYITKFGGNISDLGKKIKGATVKFGSTKRVSPKGLNWADLERHQYYLKPPTDDEAIGLYFMHNSAGIPIGI